MSEQVNEESTEYIGIKGSKVQKAMKALYLNAFKSVHSVGQAMTVAGIKNARTLTEWRRNDERFAEYEATARTIRGGGLIEQAIAILFDGASAKDIADALFRAARYLDPKNSEAAVQAAVDKANQESNRPIITPIPVIVKEG